MENKETRTYVYGEDCSKCHSLKPRVERSAQSKMIDLKELEIKDCKDPNVMTIPTLIVENGETVKYLTDESLVEYIRP